MTVEIISRTISMKVLDRAGIELMTLGSAVGCTSNALRGLVSMGSQGFNISSGLNLRL